MSWRALARAALPYAAHLGVASAVFAAFLFEGRVPYFRDLSSRYAPDYVFLERALRAGVWPLWNPGSDAGAPFLAAYPLDLLLVRLLGARTTLAVGGPLHVWIAMCGATALARALGQGRWAAWTTGATFGLCGYTLSSLNLIQLCQAAAWAPWVLLAFRCLARRPSAGRAAALGLLAALQASTLAAETLLQTGIAALWLLPGRPTRTLLGRWLIALGLAAALLVPVAAGLPDLLAGTQRARGFASEEALAWSMRPATLWDAALPAFLGDPHTFTDSGYWGQPFFPDGYPYLLSVYLGAAVLTLGLAAGRRGRRWWWLAALGVALALGAHGPLEPLLRVLLRSTRAPVKFFFLASLASCLLAGFGVDAAIAGIRRRTWLVVPSLLLLAAGAALVLWPSAPITLFAGLCRELADPRAALVIGQQWPAAFLKSGAIAFVAALALCAGGRAARGAGVLAALDLALVNGSLNPSAPATFYELRAEMRRVVEQAAAQGAYRWFSYGVINSPGLRFAADLYARNRDVWLYYFDRQTLWSRTKTLDGLDGAFDEDPTGWAPAGSTLTPGEAKPWLFRQHHARLRHAGVRWVLSFHALPEDLVIRRELVVMPEIAQPLVLYELSDALPRALWVAGCEVEPDPAARRARLEDRSFDPRRAVLLEDAPSGELCGSATDGRGRVRWQRRDAHHVEIEADGAAGWVLFLEGHHANWRLESAEGTAPPLRRANGRYLAWRTRGGNARYRLTYAPAWRAPALGTALAALAAVALLLVRSRTSRGTGG